MLSASPTPRFPAMTFRIRGGRSRNAIQGCRGHRGSRYCSISGLREQRSYIRDERTSCRLSFAPHLQFWVRCRVEQGEARSLTPHCPGPERPLFLNDFRNLLRDRNGAKISLPRLKTPPVSFTLAAVSGAVVTSPFGASAQSRDQSRHRYDLGNQATPRTLDNKTMRRGFWTSKEAGSGAGITR